MTNTSIKNAFARMWAHVMTKLGEKADKVYVDTQNSTNLTAAKNYTDAEVGKVSTLVGDTSVADQISTALDDYAPDWNKMQNKPFTTVDVDTLTWDGNTNGLECVILDQGAALYHVSDIVLSPKDFTSGCMIAFDGINGFSEYSLSQEDVLNNFSDDNMFFEGNVYSIPYDNYDLDGLICPKKGIYFFGYSENDKMLDYVSKFIIGNYTGFEGRDVINQESLPIITWDIVQCKPFETAAIGGNTLEWDGNIDGLVYATVDGNEYFKLYKVSDIIPLLNEFNGGQTIINAPGNEKITLSFGNEFIEATNDNDELIGYLETDLTFAVAYEDNVVIQNYILPEAGLYLGYEGDDYVAAYASSLTLNDYTGFPSEKIKINRLPEHLQFGETLINDEKIIKPLEVKYLPEHLQFGKYEIKSNILTWDGSYTDETSVDWYKWVNRSTPTPEQLDGGTFRYTYHGETHTVTIDINDSSMVEIGENYVSISNFGIIIYEPNVAPWSEGTVFPKPGIYIEYWYGEYADTLTLLEDVLFIPTLQKIDEIYLPDVVVTKEEAMEKINPTGSGSFSMNRRNGYEIGDYSYTEGYLGVASAHAAHAEGIQTYATGDGSHSEGAETVASGNYSHAENWFTVARGDYSHAQGKYNVIDTENKYAHIVGNGAYNARANIHTLDWEGNAWFEGDVYVGSTSGTNKDEGSKKLATENYVTENYYTKAEVEALIAQAVTAAIAASY